MTAADAVELATLKAALAESDIRIAGVEAERDHYRAGMAQAVDCGQDGVCAIAPGCQRHWADRNRELVAERDAYREALAKLVSSHPGCDDCGDAATSYSDCYYHCDECRDPSDEQLETAGPLRAALALLKDPA